jgi:phage terminase large subunit-like protein
MATEAPSVGRPRRRKVPRPPRDYVDPDAYAPGSVIPLPDPIERALVCADRSRFKVRNWRPLDVDDMTEAERAMLFLEENVKVPSGRLVGKDLKLLFFQEVILYVLLDCQPSVFILSMARRNGKTFLLSCIALLYLVSWLAQRNSAIASAAMSREQAALIYKEMSRIIAFSPLLGSLVGLIPSSKRAVGLKVNAEYAALSSEAKTGFGQGIRILILDEAGQIQGPTNEYIEMLESSQGSALDPLFAVISTQAASDADYLSVMIDTATRDQPADVACINFTTPVELDISDESGWILSNPGLGVFRSLEDLRKLADGAKRIPEKENSFRNLMLNQRTARAGLWLSAAAWKDGNGPIDLALFARAERVALALDLSMRTDLTAAVLAALDDDGAVHLLPYVFAPESGIDERSLRDKVPYRTWADKGLLIPVPGSFISYDWVAAWLMRTFEAGGIEPGVIAFDRWRIELFRQDAADTGLGIGATWLPVGQGYRDMSPRLESFEGLLLDRKIRHGGHPLLTMAASNAIATRDPAGNRKLDKAKSTQRIDPLVAAVMAAHELVKVEAGEVAIIV